ncbi:FUSC family protein [Saccharopolyspora sp. 6V]|uniref:FUSC family protein n=1 Tax=Saccharopolyspora sp. 6V TaxID=2877239 RepID=UPI001CD1D163|nr:FUSC family protein [Saccharopolyspora sp. 6V]MCA1191854.1 FUSC family protein [Saccharopolyspora sp. 6V]
MPGTVLTRNLPDAYRFRLHGPFLWPAARTLLAMAVPLVLLLLTDRLDLLPAAVFGALSSVYGRAEPYYRHARTLGAVAVGMVLAVAVGELIAVYAGGTPAHEVVALAATAFVGAAATVICAAVKVGPPGGLIFAFAAGACAHLPLTTADLGPHLAVAALCAAFAWTVNVAGAAVIGLTPQRRAAATALNATATALAARTDLTARHQAAVAVDAAWNGLALVGERHRDTAEHRDLVRAVHACELLLTPGAPEITRAELLAAAVAAAAGEPLPELHPAGGGVLAPPPASRWPVIRDVLRAALRPRRGGSWLLPHGLRVFTAALLAGTIADLLGFGHAYWAAVSAVSVLQATSTATSVPRMLQRVTGTVFGVLVGAAVLGAQPTLWVLLVVLVLLQWGAEMTVTINYGLGLLFATPVALLVSALGTPADPGALAANRFWTTLLGAAVAVAAAWSLPNRAWLSRVHTALARVRALSTAEPVHPPALRGALVELHEAYEQAAGEIRPALLPTEALLTTSRAAYARLDARRA